METEMVDLHCSMPCVMLNVTEQGGLSKANALCNVFVKTKKGEQRL